MSFYQQVNSRYFLSSFESIGILVLETKFKIDFQDSDRGGHLGFSIGTFPAYFDLVWIFRINCQLTWPFSSGEEVHNVFL